MRVSANSPLAFGEFDQPLLLSGFFFPGFSDFRPASFEVRNQNLALSPQLRVGTADGNAWRENELGGEFAQNPDSLSTALAAIDCVVLEATHGRVPASMIPSVLC